MSRDSQPCRIVMSACLYGCACRYDGRDARDEALLQALPQGAVILLVCPEEFGGLGVPRPPFDLPDERLDAILAGRIPIRDHRGREITGDLLEGIRRAVTAVERFQPDRVILTEGSPSCGVRRTKIRGRKRSGPGLFAAALQSRGYHPEGWERVRPGERHHETS